MGNIHDWMKNCENHESFPLKHFALYGIVLHSYTYTYNIYTYVHLESSPKLNCVCCQGNTVATSLVKMLETPGTPV